MSKWVLERLAALELRVAELEKKLQPSTPGGRSQRMGEAWQPADATLAWAQEKFPDVEEGRERDKFRDYWRSRGEVRRDWDAAYRNWIRKEHEFSQARAPARPNGPASRTASIDQVNRERRDRVAAQLAKVWREGS